MPRAETYATRQIGLHWLVVVLVAFQFFTGGGMAAAFERGLSPDADGAGSAVVHGVIGTAILLAMIVRLVTRRSHGAPPPPRTEPSAIQVVSRGNHILFYVVLIAMPLAGMTALATGSETVAEAHAITARVLLVLIVAHIAGALWHAFKGDGVIRRMVPRRANRLEGDAQAPRRR
ncbi:cytochrome b [Palleronia sediminis]|uniref:Cytochrome b n=1 Tax=Palleronia sediminis TaxID=2547833 RepID=A0A4R6AFQ0_9RHOB|nr:cytochrome b/b6 domain-containing protein [Palleronia sediminis]TDL81844.1 cytochrome b [Palleronia sediminis]